jgi:hypothetical protein
LCLAFLQHILKNGAQQRSQKCPVEIHLDAFCKNGLTKNYKNYPPPGQFCHVPMDPPPGQFGHVRMDPNANDARFRSISRLPDGANTCGMRGQSTVRRAEQNFIDSWHATTESPNRDPKRARSTVPPTEWIGANPPDPPKRVCSV